MRAAGAKNQFTDAVALQNWLANGAFTLHAESADGGQRLRARELPRGHQEGLLPAVLLRHGGARPAARHPLAGCHGYTSGTPVSGDTWLVTTHDAHAWPELYFQGYGWLRFEPTPTGANGQGTAYAPGYSLGQVTR